MRVLVTRAAADAPALSTRLRAAGVVPVEVPLLEKTLLPWEAEGAFDWLILTSPTTVDALALGRFPPPTQVAAVGPATADRAREAGFPPVRVPAVHTGAALVAALGDLTGQRVLFPRAAEVTPGTLEGLRAAGAEVADPVAYRNDPPPRLPEALRRVWPVDLVTLLSSSAARRLGAALAAADLPPAPVVAIGPSTAETARAAGLEVAAVARSHTLEGLVDAVRGLRG